MLALILLGVVWTPYDSSFMDATARLKPPSMAHIFGTDNFGRDLFSRILEGAGTTAVIALMIVLIGLFFGTIIGAISGYSGGWIDEVLMRICDAITAFPNVMLALVLIAIFGTGDTNVVWVLGILFIPSYSKVVRSEFKKQKNLNYIKSARLMGAGPLRIIFVHILPNIWSVLFPTIIIGFNNAVLAEASMSFLGIGVSANKPSLGRMLNEAQNFLVGGAPWYAIFVGLTIVLLILGLSMLGEGLTQQRRDSNA
ncbi:MAG: ABC transporter permease [Firmicutes bacterium]|nr:ABC transporter permease [Bacillota bacterium]